MRDFRNRFVLGLVFATGIIGAACGSDSKSSGGGGGASSTGGTTGQNNVTPATLCQRLAEIQCAAEAACCTDPGRDEATCIAAQKADFCEAVYLDKITAESITGFNATKAAAAFGAF